jgi:hypothetical protein
VSNIIHGDYFVHGDFVKIEDWYNPSKPPEIGVVVHPDSQEHHGGSHRYRVLFRERLTWFYNYELVKV